MTTHPCYFVVADRWPWDSIVKESHESPFAFSRMRLNLPLAAGLPTQMPAGASRAVMVTAVIAVALRVEITNVRLAHEPGALHLYVNAKNAPKGEPFIGSVVDCKDEGLQAELERITTMQADEIRAPARRILRGMIHLAMYRTRVEYPETPLTVLDQAIIRALATDAELAASTTDPSILCCALVRGTLPYDPEGASA